VIAGHPVERSQKLDVAIRRELASVAREEHHGFASDHQEVLSMCHEWWMRRRVDETEENRRLWGEFEHVRPVTEPDVTVEDPKVTLEERASTPTAAER
jgi:hypothetical protein